MKSAIFIVFIITFLFCTSYSQVLAYTTEEDAIIAAEEWLSLVDADEYGKSWDRASELFKRSVSKEAWEKSLKVVRTSFGALINRTLISAEYATSLPGAPDGEYVVIQFSARFKNKASAIETITPMKDPDGIWRVSGYYIK